jgi:DNA-directed RNA polymerase I subunit RPA2
MFNSKKAELQKQANIDLKQYGLESDGLPPIGKKMEHGDAEMCVYDRTLEKAKFVKFKDNESARIDSIRLMSDEKNSANNVQVGFTIRYPRNPVIGDKFSSRHGQKGVMSVLWP